MQFYVKNGHFAFLSPHFGSLGATYTVHLRLTGKYIKDFLLAISEFFLLVLQLRHYKQKSIENWHFRRGESVSAKFSPRRGRPPPVIFAWIVRPINALQLCRYRSFDLFFLFFSSFVYCCTVCCE